MVKLYLHKTYDIVGLLEDNEYGLIRVMSEDQYIYMVFRNGDDWILIDDNVSV